MSWRSIRNRIARLERRIGIETTPGWREYESAKDRDRARVLLSAFSKMLGEERSERRQPRLEQDRALLEGGTEEQRQRDRDVIARYEEAHGVHYDLDALAEKAREKLEAVRVSTQEQL